MNKLVCTLTAALVLAGGIAYGQSTSKPTHNKQQSKTRVLSDKNMDKVTAAGEEQESIAADHSSVTENNTGTVNLSGNAQMGATGVNIVNESDGLAADGVNVVSAGSSDKSDIKQANVISQSSRTEATLKSYKHGPDSEYSKVTTSDDTASSTSSATLNASLNHSESENDSDTATNVVTSASTNSSASTKNNSETESHSSNFTENGNDTTSHASTSNSASSSVKGGSASNVGNSTSTNSSASAGNTSSSNDTAANNLSVKDGGSASNSTSNSATTDTDAKTGARSSSETETSASTSNTSSSKNDSATHNTTDTDSSTESTVASLAWTKNDSKSSHNVNNSTTISNVQGPVSFDSASAQNIAVDNSSISATNNYSVILAGNAEQNAKAMNIVNAAGGMVANGVNVARTTAASTTPSLVQSNSITQTR